MKAVDYIGWIVGFLIGVGVPSLILLQKSIKDSNRQRVLKR